MPKFLAIYSCMARILGYLLILVFVPMVFLMALVLALIGSFLPERNTKNQLTDKTLKSKLAAWITHHQSKFKSVTEKIPEKNYDWQIDLIPINTQALPISFVIGGQLLLGIQIGQFNLSFEQDFLEAHELDSILESYLSGDYHILQRSIDGVRIETVFKMKSKNGKYYHCYDEGADKITAIERRAAIQDQINFAKL